MRRVVVFWSLFWAGFAVLDLAADRRGASLCTGVRHIFKAHTPAGRARMLTVYAVGAYVLGAHLGKQSASQPPV